MLSSLIKPENIILDLASTDKEELFSEMVEFLVRKNPAIDREEALSLLLARENQKNTAIDKGVAVPHARLSSIENSEIVIGISKAGIDYEISDLTKKDDFVHLVIMILFESGKTEYHLHLLSDIASLINSKLFYPQVLNAKDNQKVYNMIREIEYGSIGN